MHELTTTTPDFIFWTLTLLLVTRLLASGNPRWWLADRRLRRRRLEAKWNIAFLGSLRARLPASAARRQPRPLLRSRYLADRGGDRRRPGGPGPDLAGRPRLAEPGRLPRIAGGGLA